MRRTGDRQDRQGAKIAKAFLKYDSLYKFDLNFHEPQGLFENGKLII
jgi:hypothetical protein